MKRGMKPGTVIGSKYFDGPAYLWQDGVRRNNPAYVAARRAATRSAQNAHQKAYCKRHPDRKHASALKFHRKHLPTPTRPDPLKCECCGSPPTGNKKVLHLDHCHETETFRGWLCTRCNTSIGGLGDNIAGVQRALDYLKRVKNVIA